MVLVIIIVAALFLFNRPESINNDDKVSYTSEEIAEVSSQLQEELSKVSKRKSELESELRQINSLKQDRLDKFIADKTRELSAKKEEAYSKAREIYAGNQEELNARIEEINQELDTATENEIQDKRTELDLEYESHVATINNELESLKLESDTPAQAMQLQMLQDYVSENEDYIKELSSQQQEEVVEEVEPSPEPLSPFTGNMPGVSVELLAE